MHSLTLQIIILSDISPNQKPTPTPNMNTKTQNTLEKILIAWETREQKVEDKLDQVEKYILEHVGLKEEASYYVQNGKFFERYVAGFVDGIFWKLKTFSYLFLDPFHIFDIIIGFVKGIVKHPIGTMKQMWKTWTFVYTNGPYSLGFMTSDALFAALIAGANTAIKGGTASEIAKNSVKTGINKATAWLDGPSNKIKNLGNQIKETISSSDDFFQMIRNEPHNVITDAKGSLQKGIAIGKIKTYKLYAKKYIKKHIQKKDNVQ